MQLGDFMDSTHDTLTIHHRCDYCDAQAYVKVVSNTTAASLLFCAHHHRKNEDALVAGGWVIVQDARARLLVQPGASA
jgi:hypothetical protein